MEAVLASGKVKAIGVSNCGVPILEKLSKTWKVVPAVNQVRRFLLTFYKRPGTLNDRP